MGEPSRYPRLFGKYVLVAPLARGGMGELHLAIAGRGELKKLCAIKQILQNGVDQKAVSRFVDEAKVMVKLSHGNVVPVFESGMIDGQYYLAMEYIEGRDLRALWQALEEREQPCPVEVALHIVRQICRGLAYVHTFADLGLIHRDISPSNVLISSSGEVKVADFGLAYSRLKVQKTAPGVLFGKLSYMAPEQARREPLDGRADLYSAGVILWELVTGRRLFPRSGTLRDQLQRAFDPRFELPSKVNPSLPPALDLIVSRALAQRPDERYPSAELMRRDIAGLLAGIDPTTDASSLQRLLREVFGEQLDQERQRRQQLLERQAPVIQRLQGGASPAARGGASPSGEGWPAGLELVGEKSIDSDTSAGNIEIGTLLGQRYRIESLIGAGGMGVVYRATHIGIDRAVAIKVLHPLYSWLPEVVSRFQREAKAASRVGHPNIVEVFDSGTTDDGCLYFAMEYLEGEDLAHVLSDSGLLPLPRAVSIGVQVCRALQAAHEAGVVHRDLKPDNVFLVSKDGQPDFVKLLDFGVAQNLALDADHGDRLTNPGTAMGTPEYMSPEQAAGRPSDQRADIYATGAILYEMLSGTPPDAGQDTLDVFNRKAASTHTPLRYKRPDVPEPLAKLIHQALAFAPEDRPQSIAQLAYELTKLTEGRRTAVAALLGLAHPHRETGPTGTLPLPPGITGPGYPAADTPGPFSGLPDAQSALHTVLVPTLSRPRHSLRNVAIGVALVAAGMTIGAFALKHVLEMDVRGSAPTSGTPAARQEPRTPVVTRKPHESRSRP